MKKYPFVRQIDSYDCAIACLSMIVKYYGGNISLSKIRKLTKTTNNGTTAYGIIMASKEIGLLAKGYEVDEYKNLKVPFIAHLKNNNMQHFVVVYEFNFTKKTVLVADPASGLKRISLELFLSVWSRVAIFFEKEKEIVKENNKMNLFKLIKKYIKPYKKISGVIIIFSIICIIASISLNFLLKNVIDDVTHTSIKTMLLIFLIVIGIKNISDYFRNIIILKCNLKIDTDFTLDTCNRILKLPYSYYQERSTGEIISRLQDMENFKELITQLIISLLVNLLLILFFLGTLLIINRVLFIIILTEIIIYCLISLICFFKANIKTNCLLSEEGKTHSELTEYFKSYNTIKSLNLYNYIGNKIKEQYNKYTNIKNKYNKFKLKEIITKSVMSDIYILLIIIVGISLVLNGKLTIGLMVTFYTISVYLISPLDNILSLSYLIK